MSPTFKITVRVVVATSFAFVAWACGSRPSATAPYRGAAAFAGCMRSHAVPNWPDPTSSGSFDKSKLTTEALGASGAKVQAAQTACRSLLPGGGRVPDASRLAQARAQGLQFARCVRSHGVPAFPDPGSDGRIPDPATVGINQGSPKFEAANQACGRWRPPYMPSNAAYNAYARAHGGSS